MPRCQDHPRVCGEQFNIVLNRKLMIGSPPRVRGTVAGGRIIRVQGGITPACAGNSSPGAEYGPAARDHPRVCGEQVRLEQTFYKDLGSPPRVRGTDERITFIGNTFGITPACAGNSPWQERGAGNDRDHPRVCGEQKFYDLVSPQDTGSPPRVRGTVHQGWVGAPRRRITPACAGNSYPLAKINL